VAGRITEEFYRPTVILEKGEEESRASARSIPEFHITHALDECADLLVRHGGHAMAAGFTVKNGNVDKLRKKLKSIATKAFKPAKSKQETSVLMPTLMIDKELRLRDIELRLAEELKKLEPTGSQHRPPLFKTCRLKVVEYKTIGEKKEHLKLKLRDETQPPIDAIAFGFGDQINNMPEFIDVVYYIEINEWQGRKNVQLRVEDMKPSGVNDA
jgi:single-stranded-DNA-specific exonuclease